MMAQERTHKHVSIWTGLRTDTFTLTFPDGSLMRLIVGSAPGWLEALVFASQVLSECEYTVADGDPELPCITTIGVVWSPLCSDQEAQ
jgi:hypothetical protein